MKKLLGAIVATAALIIAFNANTAFAGDKEVTVKGSTKCSACSLHQSTSCNTVIQTKEDGKTVNYFIAENESGKKLEKLCHSGKKVVATGTVKEEDGKRKLTVSKFEVANN